MVTWAKKDNHWCICNSVKKASLPNLYCSFFFCWGRLHRHQCLFSWGRLHRHQCLFSWGRLHRHQCLFSWGRLHRHQCLFCWGRLHRHQCLFCWGRLHRHQCFFGWGRLHRHQCLFSWGRLHRHQCLFSWGRLHRHQCLLKDTPNPLSLKKGSAPRWISFRKLCCRHGMMSRCIAFVCLPQWSWFLPPNYNLFNLHWGPRHYHNKNNCNSTTLKDLYRIKTWWLVHMVLLMIWTVWKNYSWKKIMAINIQTHK